MHQHHRLYFTITIPSPRCPPRHHHLYPFTASRHYGTLTTPSMARFTMLGPTLHKISHVLYHIPTIPTFLRVMLLTRQPMFHQLCRCCHRLRRLQRQRNALLRLHLLAGHSRFFSVAAPRCSHKCSLCLGVVPTRQHIVPRALRVRRHRVHLCLRR